MCYTQEKTGKCFYESLQTCFLSPWLPGMYESVATPLVMVITKTQVMGQTDVLHV